jgi:peptidoglycan/LPS O-acetylase OafA/YrhL
VTVAQEGLGTVPAVGVVGPPVSEVRPRRPAEPASRQDRFAELDGLRGIAAITVVIDHLLFTLPAVIDRPQDLWVLKYTPLHLAWAGHQAVVLFFILSGFVLALPFYSRPVSYLAFAVRRVFRICVPYWAAVVFAVVASEAVGHREIPALSSWFNGLWHGPLTYQLVLAHLLLLGSFPSNVLDPVLWSLVYEMRISLVFPILMAFLLKYGWRGALPAAAAMVLIGFVVERASLRLGHPNDFGDSLRYVPMFMAGALLCGARGRIIAWFGGRRALFRLGCFLLAILAYTFPFWSSPMPGSRSLHFKLFLIEDYVTALGASGFLLFALTSVAARRTLTSAPVRWLGRISYSLYLFHAIVLLAMLNLLFGRIPLWAIFALTLCAALLLATLSYRLLERPSITLGHRLSARISTARKRRRQPLLGAPEFPR